MTQKIFLMCGIPGSGKSFWIQNQISNNQTQCCVISRDKIRFSLLKDGEDYFKRENAVFAQFVKEINNSIENGIPYIFIDATHISIASRAKILNRVRASNSIDLSVEVFSIPLEICLERNSLRTGREQVPPAVIKSMANQFQFPTYAEFQKYSFREIRIYEHTKEEPYGKYLSMQ